MKRRCETMTIDGQQIYVGTILYVVRSSGMARAYIVDELYLYNGHRRWAGLNHDSCIAYDEDGESLIFDINDQRVVHVDNSNCVPLNLVQNISCLIDSMIIMMATEKNYHGCKPAD